MAPVRPGSTVTLAVLHSALNCSFTPAAAVVFANSCKHAGMNKMVINHLEKLFVTSDASTIVTEMDVYHPAAKLLVMAAKAQAGEVGDATNLVCMAPCFLLEQYSVILALADECF